MKAPLLNGSLHSHALAGWKVCWEAADNYRHWCTQVRAETPDAKLIVVELFNPGSLAGHHAEKKLRRDTTLRTLREVLAESSFGCLIINLFDYAAPNPSDFFANWDRRDRAGSPLVYGHLPMRRIVARILAYGDYEDYPDADIASAITARIDLLNSWFKHLPIIPTPANTSGTPAHVRRWPMKGDEGKVSEAIAAFSKKMH